MRHPLSGVNKKASRWFIHKAPPLITSKPVAAVYHLRTSLLLKMNNRMAGFLCTGTARNENTQALYAEVDVNEGWTVRPQWPSMEELLNEQYGPSSSLSSPAMGFYTGNVAVRAVQFPDTYELVILRKGYDKEEPPPSEPGVGVVY